MLPDAGRAGELLDRLPGTARREAIGMLPRAAEDHSAIRVPAREAFAATVRPLPAPRRGVPARPPALAGSTDPASEGLLLLLDGGGTPRHAPNWRCWQGAPPASRTTRTRPLPC